MATIVETGVRVRVTLIRDDTGDHVLVAAESLDAGGTVIRHLPDADMDGRVRAGLLDVTGSLTAGQLTTIKNVLDVAEAKAKAYFGIA